MICPVTICRNKIHFKSLNLLYVKYKAKLEARLDFYVSGISITKSVSLAVDLSPNRQSQLPCWGEIFNTCRISS